MNLKQLIYKRIVHAEDIGCLLAKYSGKPAVFDTEAPDDKQDGWDGKTQYPRLNIVLDMQANEERSSVGSLTITIYTERTSMVILEIESLVKPASGIYLFPRKTEDRTALHGREQILFRLKERMSSVRMLLLTSWNTLLKKPRIPIRL